MLRCDVSSTRRCAVVDVVLEVVVPSAADGSTTSASAAGGPATSDVAVGSALDAAADALDAVVAGDADVAPVCTVVSRSGSAGGDLLGVVVGVVAAGVVVDVVALDKLDALDVITTGAVKRTDSTPSLAVRRSRGPLVGAILAHAAPEATDVVDVTVDADALVVAPAVAIAPGPTDTRCARCLLCASCACLMRCVVTACTRSRNTGRHVEITQHHTTDRAHVITHLGGLCLDLSA
jgi:hypothetical protein